MLVFVRLSNCVNMGRLVGNREGGCPRFNDDGRSDTPCFVGKYNVWIGVYVE